jgi:hypothetical protein
MSPDINAPGVVPGEFVATVGGTDHRVPPPWRASYVVSLSMAGGVRLMYVIDHAAVLPRSVRVPVGMRRRRTLARLVLASGILTSRSDTGNVEALAGQADGWLCASVGPVQRALPLDAVLGGVQIAEAFRAAVPASVWGQIAEHRSAFLAAHPHSSAGLLGTLGALGGEGR